MFNQAVSDYRDSLEKPPPIPVFLGAFIDGAFTTLVATDPSLTYVRYLDDTPTTAKHRNRVNLATTNENIPISLYYDEFDELAILDFDPTQAGAVLEGDPGAGVPYHTHDDRYYTEAEVDALIGGGGGGMGDFIHVEDQKTQNTPAGTFTNGGWQPRDLNTEVTDTGNHASVASNQITLLAGTYRIKASAPAYSVGRHRLRWQNITDTATTLRGENGYAGTGNATPALLSGRFTIAGTKTFELQHQCEITVSSNGLGVESNWDVEVYAVVELWRE